jgi:hypothetical protein
VQSGSAGENTSQALQNGLYRGLIGQGGGRTQQHSISIFGDGHGATVPRISQLKYLRAT